MEVKAVGCGIDETLTTDGAGLVFCEPKDDGVLSVRTRQIDPVSGELNGEKYDSIRTYSTLTLPWTLPVIETVPHTLPPLFPRESQVSEPRSSGPMSTSTVVTLGPLITILKAGSRMSSEESH